MKKILLFIGLAFWLVGCSSSSVPVGDTPENSLSWPGIYKGTLPCADCEGINTTLVLNIDNTFSLEDTYLTNIEGVKAEYTPEAISGTFQWDKKNLSIIHLVKSDDRNISFFVAESRVIFCDQEGKPITDSEFDYSLKQVESFY